MRFLPEDMFLSALAPPRLNIDGNRNIINLHVCNTYDFTEDLKPWRVHESLGNEMADKTQARNAAVIYEVSCFRD